MKHNQKWPDSFIPQFLHIVKRKCVNGWKNPIAARNYHSIIFVISGKGILHFDSKHIPIEKGDLIYNAPGEIRGFDSDNKESMVIYAIYFNLANCYYEDGKWQIENVDKLPFETITKVQNQSVFLRHFYGMTNEWILTLESTTAKNISLFYSFVMDIKDYMKTNGNRNHRQEQIAREAMEYIQKNFAQK